MISRITQKIRQEWPLFLILVLTIVAYAHTITHPFFSDDFVWIHFGELGKADVGNIFRLKVTSFFSPVVNAYMTLGQTLFPFSAPGYHILGLIIHVCNVILVYLVGKKIGLSQFAATIGTITFSFLGYHYEAIIWISAIMHVLVTTFVLLGLYSFLYYEQTKKRMFLFGTALAALTAFFTKENGIMLIPMALCLHFFYEKERTSWKEYITSCLPRLWPIFITLFGLLFYAWQTQHASQWITRGVYHIAWGGLYKLASSTAAMIDPVLGQWLSNHPSVFLLTGSVFIGGLIAGRFLFREGTKYIVLGLALTILSFAPVMFFYFGSWQMIDQARYSYLPSVGLAIVAIGIVRSIQILSSKKPTIGMILICLLLAIWGNRQHSLILTSYTKEYIIIGKQMTAMIDTLKKIETEVTPRTSILLTGGQPFYGNEYYRHMYRYMVDPTRQKSIDDWLPAEKSIEAALEYRKAYPNTFLLEWKNEPLGIYLLQ